VQIVEFLNVNVVLKVTTGPLTECLWCSKLSNAKFTLFVRSRNFLYRPIDIVLAATIMPRSVKEVNYCEVWCFRSADGGQLFCHDVARNRKSDVVSFWRNCCLHLQGGSSRISYSEKCGCSRVGLGERKTGVNNFLTCG